MNILACALAAITSGLVLVSAAERPLGDTCDDLPRGYCHRRTQQDEEFVRKWNENYGKGLFVRHHLVDVDGSAPSAPFAPAVYESVEGILLAYDVSDLEVVAGIAAAVTNQARQETKVFMVVANANQKLVAEAEFINAGVNMDRVVWVDKPIDSVWIRDYGGRYICHTDLVEEKKASVDTKYYSSRVNDDMLPTKLGNGGEVGLYTNFDLNAELMHSGGNGHFFSTRKAFSTNLVLLDNTARTEEQIKTYWNNYLGADLHIFPKLSFNVDGTGHIDMWFLPVNDAAVIIGQYH